MKNIVTVLMVILFLSVSVLPLSAENETAYGKKEDVPSGDAMIADLILVRPVGMAAVVVGFGMSILAMPFALASGSTREVYQKLLVEPFDFAFSRPLGSF